MVRPVQGYVTSSGKFFDTMAEAKRYEATHELIECIQNDVTVKDLFRTADPTTINYLIEIVFSFIESYHDQITAFIETHGWKDQVTEANPLQNDNLVRTVVAGASERTEEEQRSIDYANAESSDDDPPF